MLYGMAKSAIKLLTKDFSYLRVPLILTSGPLSVVIEVVDLVNQAIPLKLKKRIPGHFLKQGGTFEGVSTRKGLAGSHNWETGGTGEGMLKEHPTLEELRAYKSLTEIK